MIYYTSIEQSDKLLELGLPLKSADMFYNEEPDEIYPKNIVDTKCPSVIREEHKHYLEEYGIPCWSLGALLEVMPESYQLTKGKNNKYQFMLFHNLIHDWFNTPLEAVYNMVCYLLENGLIKNCKS